MDNNKKLIKIRRLEHCISFQIVKKIGNNIIKSSDFLITKNEINRLINDKYLISKDIHNFASINIHENKLNIEFYWLNSSINGIQVKGNIEYITIDYNKFVNWYNTNQSQLKLLETIEVSKVKINFINSKNLKEALTDKKLKKNLLSLLLNMQKSYNIDQIDIYDDSYMNSFYFCKYKTSKFISNGGIIYNKNSHDYSIHT